MDYSLEGWHALLHVLAVVSVPMGMESTVVMQLIVGSVWGPAGKGLLCWIGRILALPECIAFVKALADMNPFSSRAT